MNGSLEHAEEDNCEHRLDELSPLLHPAAMETDAARHLVRRQYTTIFLCALAVVFIDMGCFLTSAPQLRLFESIVCRDYYKGRGSGPVDPHGDIPEHLCKINAVQDEVAFLDGYQMLFDNIPGAHPVVRGAIPMLTTALP